MFKIFTKIIFIFISLKSFSQVDYIKNNASLWLKNDSVTTCSSSNYNCSLKQLEKNYKLYSNQFSFFIAFKTEGSEAKDIVSLKYGQKSIKISNKNVLKQNDTISHLNESTKAKIVSYLHNDMAFSKKGKLIIDLEDNSEDNILEIIFIPKVISKSQREKIETYLSLKYGFSLAKNQYYRSVKNDTLWDPKKSKAFSNDITGFGSDIENFYTRAKSYNHNYQGFEIYSDTLYPNNNYLLWGHNGKSEMIVNHNKLSTLAYKIWHVNKRVSATYKNKLHLKIKNELLNQIIDTLQKNESIYLYVSQNNSEESIDLLTGKYYKGVLNSNKDIVFENIDLLNQSRFIFLKAPENHIFTNTIGTCEQPTQLQLNFVTASFPIQLFVSNDKVKRSYLVEQVKYEINDLPEGKYNIDVVDVFNNKKNIQVEINNTTKFQLKMKESWNLNQDNYVVVTPEILKLDKKLHYTWKKEGQILGSEFSLQINEVGNYELEVTDGICEEKFQFKVNSNDNSSVSLYPNPSKTSEEVTIQLGQAENDFVEVKINDLNGKLIKTLIYKDLKTNIIKFNFDFSGVYFVHLKTKHDNKVFKVIIN